MKFFLDTEFIESGPAHPIQLISIGIVAEDGRELYAVSSEYDSSLASDWVRENVLVNINPHGEFFSLKEIAAKIKEFIWPKQNRRDAPEFWGYYADYDWVVFCQIFGTMTDLPTNFPMYCRDIKQWCDSLGNPRLPKQSSTEHNALNDARWNREAWIFLLSVAWQSPHTGVVLD
jgi:hypothetical protein